MKKAQRSDIEPGKHRQKAEESIRNNTSYNATDMDKGDMVKLVHELRVHQLELKMQNEELATAVAKAATAIELYDFAPAAYFTLQPNGTICELNHSGARMLGKERSKLTESNFKLFIAPEYLIHFNTFLNSVFETNDKQICEVKLAVHGIPSSYILIEGIVSSEKKKCLLSAIDITELKRTQKALQDSESIYRNLIEKMPDGVYKSTHEGNFVEVNPAMVSILGYNSKEELFAIDIKTQLYFNPAERDSLTLDEMREELGIFRLRKKDGSEIWVEDHGWYTSAETGETLYHEGVIRDVTGRIQAENALHESELVYRNLIEKLPDGVYKTTHQGKFVEINSAMVSMLGYDTKEELMAIDIKTQLYFDPDERESLVLEQKHREMGIYRLRKKDGTEIWVEDHGWYSTDENGEILFHEGIMRDITDRKNAEEALKESQMLFQNLTIVSPVGIFRSDVNGSTTYVNPRWSELSGLSFDEAMEYGWLRAVHPDDKARLSVNWDTDVDNKHFSTAEYRFVKPNGSIVYVLGYAVPEINDGVICGFIGSITDITRLKQAEEENKQLNEELEKRVIHRTAQLEAANKELEAFSYSISHDLRTPLRALDGFANFLLEDYSQVLDAEGKRMLRIIIENANKMGYLIDDLLAFSRLSRYKLVKTKIDMKAMALSVYQELASETDINGIDFRLQNIPEAFGDPSMIRQVWLNLISNAIKYTSKKQNRIIEVFSINKNSENVFVLKDNGAGFNMAYYEKIFGVFQRLHTIKDFDGTGIGLAIVKRIVTRHHGRVWAESVVDEGATFYFTMGIDGK